MYGVIFTQDNEEEIGEVGYVRTGRPSLSYVGSSLSMSLATELKTKVHKECTSPPHSSLSHRQCNKSNPGKRKRKSKCR